MESWHERGSPKSGSRRSTKLNIERETSPPAQPQRGGCNVRTEKPKFDYGFRGTPAIIKLGFDASKALHDFTIEWDPCEIRWFVDQKLVHRRATWEPTPIPHLPMTLHVNTWPTRSRELAGRLALRALPAAAIVRRVAVDTYNSDARAHSQPSTAAACDASSPLKS